MGRFVTLVLGAALLLVPPQYLSAQKKPKKSKDNVKLLDTTPQDYQALYRFEGIYGRLVTVDPVNRKIRMRVEYQVPRATGRAAQGQDKAKQNRQNQGARRQRQGGKKNAANKRNRNNQQRSNQQRKRNNKNRNRNNNRRNGQGTNAYRLAREYAQIQKIRNPVQRQMRMQQFLAKLNRAQQQQLRKELDQLRRRSQQVQRQLRSRFPMAKPKGRQPGIEMITVAKEFILYLAPNVRVARKELPFEYDEKGFVKEYTEEEKKKLRDDVLPGYKAEFEDLVPGQVVYLYFKKLATGKAPSQTPPAGNPQGAGPIVTGVLIIVDAVPDFPQAEPRRGRKKR